MNKFPKMTTKEREEYNKTLRIPVNNNKNTWQQTRVRIFTSNNSFRDIRG